jgi:hypothetical protein
MSLKFALVPDSFINIQRQAWKFDDPKVETSNLNFESL